MMDDDDNRTHPYCLPQDGVDPDDLPPYPDVRPGWDTPYTIEAKDSYATPEEFARKCK